MEYKKLRVIISGGGTGGHIFPAISIADKLKEVNPETEILFVGAEGKMEMEKVPARGYRIVGLPVRDSSANSAPRTSPKTSSCLSSWPRACARPAR